MIKFNSKLRLSIRSRRQILLVSAITSAKTLIGLVKISNILIRIHRPLCWNTTFSVNCIQFIFVLYVLWIKSHLLFITISVSLWLYRLLHANLFLDNSKLPEESILTTQRWTFSTIIVRVLLIDHLYFWWRITWILWWQCPLLSVYMAAGTPNSCQGVFPIISWFYRWLRFESLYWRRKLLNHLGNNWPLSLGRQCLVSNIALMKIHFKKTFCFQRKLHFLLDR